MSIKERNMEERLIQLNQVIKEVLGPDYIDGKLDHQELTIQVYNSAIVRTLTILKDHPECRFKMLVDICGVDCPDRLPRFEVVYHLLSLHNNLRLRIKVSTDGETPTPSVVSIYNCANWYEREVWDLFGIPFSDHPDLRRILTDYTFEGYPLRKDFPLTGYIEVRYDDALKRVVYEPVKLSQEFRSFDFLSPWEGLMNTPNASKLNNLPGEEKVSS